MGVGKIGSVVATNLFPALNPDALCRSQLQTVHTLVGAALKETLGTVQKHSIWGCWIQHGLNCEGTDRKIGVGSGDAQPTGDSG